MRLGSLASQSGPGIWAQRQALRLSARRIVTPFAPLIVCDYYLSTEVDSLGLQWLNRKARNLRLVKVTKVSPLVFFCQADEVAEFISRVLPQISGAFVLITGKWELPAIQEEDFRDEILSHPQFAAWYTQNQIFSKNRVNPFPYGVRLENAPLVAWMSLRRKRAKIASPVLVPYCKEHLHLSPEVAADRRLVSEFMSEKKPLQAYLEDVLTHRYVVSPAGDRPDTYRHWECILLGSYPVSNQREALFPLFGKDMIYVSSLEDAISGSFRHSIPPPNYRLGLVSDWRARIRHDLGSHRGQPT